MKVSDVMTQKVEIARPGDTLQAAAQTMARIDSGMLPVGDNDRLVGIITDRDIAIRGAGEGKDPTRTCVRDVMTAEVKYVFEDDEVSEVAENMAQLQVRRLPVVNRDKRLCGIISLADIARQQSTREAGEALQGIAQPGGQHSQH